MKQTKENDHRKRKKKYTRRTFKRNVEWTMGVRKKRYRKKGLIEMHSPIERKNWFRRLVEDKTVPQEFTQKGRKEKEINLLNV